MISVLLYAYGLVAAFCGGYMLCHAIDDADEDFPAPPLLTTVVLSLFAPIAMAVLLLAGVCDRMTR